MSDDIPAIFSNWTPKSDFEKLQDLLKEKRPNWYKIRQILNNSQLELELTNDQYLLEVLILLYHMYIKKPWTENRRPYYDAGLQQNRVYDLSEVISMTSANHRRFCLLLMTFMNNSIDFDFSDITWMQEFQKQHNIRYDFLRGA